MVEVHSDRDTRDANAVNAREALDAYDDFGIRVAFATGLKTQCFPVTTAGRVAVQPGGAGRPMMRLRSPIVIIVGVVSPSMRDSQGAPVGAPWWMVRAERAGRVPPGANRLGCARLMRMRRLSGVDYAKRFDGGLGLFHDG